MTLAKKLALVSTALLLAMVGALIVAAPQSASPGIPLSGTFAIIEGTGSVTYNITTEKITSGTSTSTHTLSGSITGQRTTTATYNTSNQYWYLSELVSNCTVSFNDNTYQGRSFGRGINSNVSPDSCYPDYCIYTFDTSFEGAVWTIEEPYAFIRVNGSGSGTWNQTSYTIADTIITEVTEMYASGTWSGSLEFLSIEAQVDETASGSLTMAVPGEGTGVLNYDTTGEGTTLLAPYESNPAGPLPGIALKFFEMDTTVNSPDIGWPILFRYFYSEEQVEAAGIDENTLKIYKWDGSSWVEVADSGVNQDENYVWVNLESFSIYAVAGAEGGCFIATAAYGTDTAGQLDMLRAFRDQVLLESTLGSQLVALYYDVSPPIADFIAENDLLRAAVRELLIDPIVSLSSLTQGIWGN